MKRVHDVRFFAIANWLPLILSRWALYGLHFLPFFIFWQVGSGNRIRDKLRDRTSPNLYDGTKFLLFLICCFWLQEFYIFDVFFVRFEKGTMWLAILFWHYRKEKKKKGLEEIRIEIILRLVIASTLILSLTPFADSDNT